MHARQRGAWIDVGFKYDGARGAGKAGGHARPDKCDTYASSLSTSPWRRPASGMRLAATFLAQASAFLHQVPLRGSPTPASNISLVSRSSGGATDRDLCQRGPAWRRYRPVIKGRLSSAAISGGTVPRSAEWPSSTRRDLLEHAVGLHPGSKGVLHESDVRVEVLARWPARRRE